MPQGVTWMIAYSLLAGLTVVCGLMVIRNLSGRTDLKLAPAGDVPLPPSDQIMEKPAPVESFTDKPPSADSGDKEAAESDNGADASDGESEKPPEEVAEKQVAVALKGAKRWRKKKVEASQAITRSAPSKKAPKSVPAMETPALAGQPTMATMLHWIALAFVPSSMFIGATNYMSTDIAAIPLLWIIPLGIYLLSFILVFSRLPSWVHHVMVLSLPVAMLLLVFIIVQDYKPERHFLGIPPIVLIFIIHLATLFIVAMVCHGELARARPATQYLTGYFLCMSFGGVLGGTFNALIAPVVFNSLAEYQLVMVVACMLLPPLALETKSTLNWWIDALLAIGLGAAGLYAAIQWVKRLMRLAEENPTVEFRKIVDISFSIPGVKPGVTAIVVWCALLAVLLVYMGPPTFAWLARKTSGWPWLNQYVNGRKQPWYLRHLDVLLPLALFLLTAELIIENPFKNWGFGWMIRLFWGDVAPGSEAYDTHHGQIVRVFTYGLPVALCYGFAEQPIRFGLGVGAILLAGVWQTEQSHVLYQERSFFGVLKVEKTGPFNRLLHGTTLHGMQIVGSDEPLTYYHKTGPVGQAYRATISSGHERDNVAFIGLGTGTMASYVNPGQMATFYEIDRTVINISEPGEYFTYLQNCKKRNALGGNDTIGTLGALMMQDQPLSAPIICQLASTKADYHFEVGDARLKLRDASDHSYRLIVVDAFSSDAIPIHLITKEAVQLYFEKLTEDGIACIHISNRYLELGPVLGNIAKELNLHAIQQYDNETRIGARMFPGKNSSDWVMLAKKKETLDWLQWYNSFNTIQGMLDYPEILKEQGWTRRAEKAQTYQNIFQLNALGALLHANALQFAADDSHWNPQPPEPTQSTWTDDYSNIISIFRWK
jgi:spermidine synthase